MTNDLKQIFKSSDSGSSNENVIVIRKSWWALIFGYLWSTIIASMVISGLYFVAYILIFKNFTGIDADRVATIILLCILVVLFLTCILDRIVTILTSKIIIDIQKREAKIIGYAGIRVIKDIIAIDCYRNPLFPISNSVKIKGKGYDTIIGMQTIKDYNLVKIFADKFYNQY